MSTTDTPEDLELEQDQVDQDEADCELLDHEADDEVSPGYEDKLSEQSQNRIRHYVPRYIVAAGDAHDGYCEVLTEHAEIVNHEMVDKVGAHLVADDQVASIPALQGTLKSERSCEQILELTYRIATGANGTAEFVYTITLDGVWIKSFRNSALAVLTFDVLVDHAPASFPRMIEQVLDIFHTRGVHLGEDCREICTEGFAEDVYRQVGR